MPGNMSQDIDGQISHKGSIYTFMLFMPPLARKMYGHYWAPEVTLAFSLFAMSVTLQMCLTLIAGAAIVQQQFEYKTTLIQDMNITDTYLTVMLDQLEYLSYRGLEIGPQVLDQVRSHKWVRESLERREWERQHQHGDAGSESWCCIGSSCSGVNKCCPSANIAQSVFSNTSSSRWGTSASHTNLTALLQKPGGGGGKGAKTSAEPEHTVGGVKSASICTNTNGITSCLPPTVAMLGAWQSLDHNGDGLWTIEEARQDPANIGCHIGVHLEDVFRAICRGIVRDAADTSNGFAGGKTLPNELRYRTAIPRAYYQWWRGLAALCVNTEPASCGELLLRGTFDGALSNKNNGTRGGMVDLDTALAYCERVLTPGGICDNALPGSYVLYRARIKDRCGDAVPATGPRYANPHRPGDVTGVMKTSWSKLDEVANTHTIGFQFFMALILVLWYVNLVDELKDIIHLWDLLRNFPVSEEWPFLTPEVSSQLSRMKRRLTKRFSDVQDPEALDEDDQVSSLGLSRGAFGSFQLCGEVGTPRSIIITSFERPHQLTIVCMASIRSLLLLYLGYSGTYFLLSNQSYIDLLLNALALAFVFELDEFLFNFLVPEATKSKLDTLAPLTYKTCLPKKGFPSLVLAKYFWGLLCIPILAWFVVRTHDQGYTVPMMEAMACACKQVGNQCLASAIFSKSWWDDYWAEMALLRARGEL